MIEIKDDDEELRLFDVPRIIQPKTSTVPISQIQEVFDHWVQTFRSSGRGPTPVLSDKRKSKISNAIKDYGVQTCLEAISGCALSDWHMGENPRRKKYDDIELIFRDSMHIEKFATIYAEDGNSGRSEFLDD